MSTSTIMVIRSFISLLLLTGVGTGAAFAYELGTTSTGFDATSSSVYSISSGKAADDTSSDPSADPGPASVFAHVPLLPRSDGAEAYAQPFVLSASVSGSNLIRAPPR